MESGVILNGMGAGKILKWDSEEAGVDSVWIMEWILRKKDSAVDSGVILSEFWSLDGILT